MSSVTESNGKHSKSRIFLLGFIGVIVIGAAIGIPLYLNSLENEEDISDFSNVSVQTVYSMIEDDETYPDLSVLDVRTQSEYDEEHIDGAYLLPLGELETRINELSDYKDVEVIVYCRSGSRSAQASTILYNAGYLKVYNMLGGFNAWTAAGY